MFENNQSKSNGRGGSRKGAGRKAGAANVKTREIADKACELGITPLEFLLDVMRNDSEELKTRLNAAINAAPYVHAKLSSVEGTIKHEGNVFTALLQSVQGSALKAVKLNGEE